MTTARRLSLIARASYRIARLQCAMERLEKYNMTHEPAYKTLDRRHTNAVLFLNSLKVFGRLS